MLDYVRVINFCIIIIMKYCEVQSTQLIIAGEIVGLRLLCSSDVRAAKAQVAGWHSVLDGSRSHLQTSVQSGGKIHILQINFIGHFGDNLANSG